MNIFTDGAHAHPEKVNGKWVWVIDEFCIDSQIFYACNEVETEEELSSEEED